MIYLIITVCVITLFIILMAFGVIFSNKPLKGSCGGVGKLTGEDCSFCGRSEKKQNAECNSNL